MTGMDDRVALVVVHGIADQRPGGTVVALARLLCGGAGGPPRYVHGETDVVLVPVEKLAPGADAPTHPAAEPQGADAERRLPGAPSGFYQMQQPAPPAAGAPAPAARDLAAELNDYLLGRLALPEGDRLYQAARVALRRRADGAAVDLYEMYWADLSRLASGGVRALSSLYQLFFHLSTLAADLVDQVSLCADGGPPWRLLQRLHAWMAWLMRGPTALLQLAMLLMVAFGAASMVAAELQGQLLAAAFGLGAIVLTALGALTWLRRPPGAGRAARLAAFAIGAAASLALAIFVLRAAHWGPKLYFVSSALAAGLLGAYLVGRYAAITGGVRVLGHVVVLAAVATLCVEGELLLPHVTTQREWMLTASLHVSEWLFAGVLLAWALFVLVQIAALLLGLWLGRGSDARVQASLHTSRLALVCSSGLFALLSLVLWSVISFVAGHALGDLRYEPAVFGSGYRSAALFLEGRVETLGGFFTPLVVAFTLLGGAVLLVLLPSLMEDLAPTSNLDGRRARPGAVEWAKRLGAWLGGGVRVLGTAFKWLVPAGAIAGSVLYLAFVLEQFVFATGGEAGFSDWLFGVLEALQGDTLVAVGKWLAGGALTITALGARFRQTFGRLRVALDAVLDVDNYFGDPPNRQPPRARIYSRYASLLAYLRDAGYARIVIVAHSQGTVISADLLRHLHVQGRLQALVGAAPVALLTVGSPLRDLYAERFPLLYHWMGARAADFAQAGPAAAEIGAAEWVNACRSGDYVGRFVWTPDDSAASFGVALVGADGVVEARRAGDRAEFCLGAGGHTRYFSDDAVALAVEIERLIAGAAGAGAGGDCVPGGTKA